MVKKMVLTHIAKKGKMAGKPVPCEAKVLCRIGGKHEWIETGHDSHNHISVSDDVLKNFFGTVNKQMVDNLLVKKSVPNNISKLSYLNEGDQKYFATKLNNISLLSNTYVHDYEADDMSSRPGEKEFIENYDPKKYTDADVSYTADNIIFTPGDDGRLKVLLIKRGGHPYKDFWAHPGGFIDGSETRQEAAVRELKEETNVDLAPQFLASVGTYDRPGRDPRMNVVMNTHVALITKLPEFTASDDASDAQLVDVEEIFSPNSKVNMAFDHKQSISDAIKFLMK